MEILVALKTCGAPASFTVFRAMFAPLLLLREALVTLTLVFRNVIPAVLLAQGALIQTSAFFTIDRAHLTLLSVKELSTFTAQL